MVGLNSREICKEVRKLENAKAICRTYDYEGNYKKDVILPLYYKNPSSLKFCFPQAYYSEEDVDLIKFQIEEIINKVCKDLKDDLKVIMERHYIGGLHCNGWCIRIKYKK